MNTIDLFEESLQIARALGYQIRQEWLDGSGGACQFGGQRWIFIDLSLATTEQLDQLVTALSDDVRIEQIATSPALSRLLGRRQAA